MPRFTQQQAEEQYKKLPQKLKEHMASPDTAFATYEVGKKHGLTIEQIGILAEESAYVKLGLTHPRDYISNLALSLGIDADKARMIAADMNHQIFFPLRELLKQAHQFEISQSAILQEEPLPHPLPSPKPTLPLQPSQPAIGQRLVSDDRQLSPPPSKAPILPLPPPAPPSNLQQPPPPPDPQPPPIGNIPPIPPLPSTPHSRVLPETPPSEPQTMKDALFAPPPSSAQPLPIPRPPLPPPASTPPAPSPPPSHPSGPDPYREPIE